MELVNEECVGVSDSPYRTAISGAVLKLQEEGKLHILKTRWWKEKRGGGSCRVRNRDDTSKSSSAANELGLANVGGVFVVLLGGMGVACVIAVGEFVWKSRKVAVEERVRLSAAARNHLAAGGGDPQDFTSLFTEMAHELRHAIKCRGSTRPVNRRRLQAPAGVAPGAEVAAPGGGGHFIPLSPYAQYGFCSNGKEPLS
ncbi:hypothetical protein B566_EDAN010594 [Ephemera danica]|nr:hypothetical protein B566_EDAN010594 [Ephemera danica]